MEQLAQQVALGDKPSDVVAEDNAEDDEDHTEDDEDDKEDDDNEVEDEDDNANDEGEHDKVESVQMPPAAEAQELAAVPEVPEVPKRRRLNASDHPRERLHVSPSNILGSISPLPYGLITLNKNDHRWVFTWRGKNHDIVDWPDGFKKLSMSRTFVNTNRGSWEHALKEVHRFAWDKWRLGGGPIDCPLAQQNEMEPGDVSSAVFASLEDERNTLPERKAYGGASSSKGK